MLRCAHHLPKDLVKSTRIDGLAVSARCVQDVACLVSPIFDMRNKLIKGGAGSGHFFCPPAHLPKDWAKKQADEASSCPIAPRHLRLRDACSSELASRYSLRFFSTANDMWDHRYCICIIKNNGGFVKLHPKILVGL
jgi:hypothetical protein